MAISATNKSSIQQHLLQTYSQKQLSDPSDKVVGDLVQKFKIDKPAVLSACLAAYEQALDTGMQVGQRTKTLREGTRGAGGYLNQPKIHGQGNATHLRFKLTTPDTRDFTAESSAAPASSTTLKGIPRQTAVYGPKLEDFTSVLDYLEDARTRGEVGPALDALAKRTGVAAILPFTPAADLELPANRAPTRNIDTSRGGSAAEIQATIDMLDSLERFLGPLTRPSSDVVLGREFCYSDFVGVLELKTASAGLPAREVQTINAHELFHEVFETNLRVTINGEQLTLKQAKQRIMEEKSKRMALKKKSFKLPKGDPRRLRIKEQLQEMLKQARQLGDQVEQINYVTTPLNELFSDIGGVLYDGHANALTRSLIHFNQGLFWTEGKTRYDISRFPSDFRARDFGYDAPLVGWQGDRLFGQNYTEHDPVRMAIWRDNLTKLEPDKVGAFLQRYLDAASEVIDDLVAGKDVNARFIELLGRAG